MLDKPTGFQQSVGIICTELYEQQFNALFTKPVDYQSVHRISSTSELMLFTSQ